MEQNNIIKPNIYIFDLDGCIANSDDFVLTNEQAYAKDPKLHNSHGIGYRGPLTNDNKNLFSEAYLVDHQLEIQPYKGILDLFVRMSQVANTAILTSRAGYMRKCTINWLEQTISNQYNKQVWRQLNYKIFFNDIGEKSLVYKTSIIDMLSKSYNIALIIDDHPDIADYAKSKGIVCLVPATGYKNLNGNDLTKKTKISKSETKKISNKKGTKNVRK